MLKKLLMIAVVVMLLPAVANAVTILVGPGDLTGSRSTPNSSGVVAADGWTDGANGGFQISWAISEISGGWHYAYTLSNADGSTPPIPNPSHLILEVSDNFTFADIWNASPAVPNDEPMTFTSAGNPDIPGSIFGVKFNFAEGAYTVAFNSTRAPMWGDFYAKDGFHDVWATAWNTGFGTDPTSSTTDFTDWVAVPDTQTPVPEPATLLLLGSGLVGMGWFGRKRIKKDDPEA